MRYRGIFVLLGLLPALAFADVKVEDPWIAEGPPVAQVLGGFMQLRNTDAQPRALVGGSSTGFARIELHQTVHEDGMAKMVPQERIEVPAQGTTALQPGGYHLMLIEPVKPLKAGDTVELTLQFDDGSKQTLQVPVRKRPAHGGHGHGH